MRTASALALASVLLACALAGGPPSPYDIGFRGPGRLAVIWEREHADGELSRTVVVYDGASVRLLDLEQAMHTRWLSPEQLLVARELPGEPPEYTPRMELVRLAVESGAEHALVSPGRYYDPEPSPDGQWLAVGVELNDQGESELQIWYLKGGADPVATRAQPLDRPRWSPDGIDLVVSRMVSDPDDAESEESGAAVHGVGLTFPRLFRVKRSLAGELEPLRDGFPGAERAHGGSFPLWWDGRGIWARQREGLARCDPTGAGCALVYRPGEGKRVAHGRPVGANEALLLVIDTDSGERHPLPREVHRVNLESGEGRTTYRAAEGVAFVGLDWIAND